MKYVWLGLLISFSAGAQTLKLNEIDRFTKERVVQTAPVTLKASATENINLHFSSEANRFYVVLNGYSPTASLVRSDDKALLLLRNDSVVSVQSTGTQAATYAPDKSNYTYQYSITAAGLEQLSQQAVIALRIYELKGHTDYDLSPAKSEELKNTALLFYNTLVKEKVIPKLTPIKLSQVSAHIGDSVSVTGKVTGVDYMLNGAHRYTLLYLGVANLRSLLTLVLPLQQTNSVQPADGAGYLNKEVSVTGTITTEQKMPTIKLYSDNQFYVVTPVKLRELASFVGDSVLVYGRVMYAPLKEPESGQAVIQIGEDKPLLTVMLPQSELPEVTVALKPNSVIRIRGRVSWQEGRAWMMLSRGSQID